MTSTSETLDPRLAQRPTVPGGTRGAVTLPGAAPARRPVRRLACWEHRSTGIVLEFTTACLLPVRDGTAWLSRSSAPWPCATWLRIRAGGLDLALPVDTARQALGTLSPLLALAAAAGEECP